MKRAIKMTLEGYSECIAAITAVLEHQVPVDQVTATLHDGAWQVALSPLGKTFTVAEESVRHEVGGKTVTMKRWKARESDVG